MTTLPALSLLHDGAERRPAALSAAMIDTLAALLAPFRTARPGTRLFGLGGLRALLAPDGPVGSVAATMLGPRCRPVRALVLDKTPTTNWSLGWHQDRTIAVRERREVPGFANWTVKDGTIHVEPPWDVIAGMVTLRVHLDATPAENAPLLIAPGSHRLGRIPVGETGSVVARLGQAACLADAGDVWLYATPILHASDRAAPSAGRRRVLQVDYCVGELPGGLEWMGIW